MFSKKKILFNLVQNTFVGLAITITVTLLTTGFISVGAFIVSFLKAYEKYCLSANERAFEISPIVIRVLVKYSFAS